MGYILEVVDYKGENKRLKVTNSAQRSFGEYGEGYHITYNYNSIFKLLWNGNTLKDMLHDVKLSYTEVLLEQAIKALEGDITENYWDPTPGNVKPVLKDLLDVVRKHPDCFWRIT